jgi:hypothetical protein
MKRILVVGVPRSGTSWVGRILGSTKGSTYLGEPDNHEHSPFALRAKLGLPGWYYPALSSDDEPAEYGRLWAAAFGFPSLRLSAELAASERLRRKTSLALLRRSSDADRLQAFRVPYRLGLSLRVVSTLAVPDRPDREADALVVKSVHVAFALDWLSARFPVELVLVRREPLNILSSWVTLGWVDEGVADPLAELEPRVASEIAERLDLPPVPEASSRLTRAAWLIGLLDAAVRDAADRHPKWTTVSHGELCERPQERFAALAKRLGLPWSERSNELLQQLDRPGSGYETERVAAAQPEVWRDRLTEAQRDEADTVLAQFSVDAPSSEPKDR